MELKLVINFAILLIPAWFGLLSAGKKIIYCSQTKATASIKVENLNYKEQLFIWSDDEDHLSETKSVIL